MLSHPFTRTCTKLRGGGVASIVFFMRVDSFHCEYVAVPSFVGYIITRGLRRTRNLLELYDEDGVAVVVFMKKVPCEYMLMAKETFLLLLIVVEN